MLELNYFLLARLLSGIIILVMGICLLVVSVPREPELRNYRISRIFLSGAYIALSIIDIWQVIRGVHPNGGNLVMAITLIIGSLQALLYTSSLVTLINMRFVSLRRLTMHIVPILCCAVTLLVSHFILPESTFRYVLTVAIVLYCMQLTTYVIAFMREYGKYKRKLENFFSNNEEKRTLWVRNSFFAATSVGIVAAIVPFFPSQTLYVIFIGSYTVFYIYFVVKYINYVNTFHRIAPVVDITEESAVSSNTNGNNIPPALERWISEKKFILPDITLESLAGELHTNQTYLSRHINSYYGQNFKSWINSMRIAEAQKLLLERDDITLTEVSEMIGIHSSSTFYRSFMTVTGKTPAEYRRQKTESNNNPEL